MKKMNSVISVLALAAFVFGSQVVWAGEHVKEVQLPGGVKAYQYYKTSFFGQDHSGTTLVGPTPQQPPILRCQYGSVTVSETTTTFSRCKEKKEGRLTQAYFVGEEKKVIKQAGFQDAVNPANGQPPWTATIGGSGPSTGNLLLPAMVIGAGNAFSGGTYSVVQGGVSAVSKAKGGNQQQGQNTKVDTDVKTKSTNINPNTNIIDVNATGTGTGIGTGTAASTSN